MDWGVIFTGILNIRLVQAQLSQRLRENCFGAVSKERLAFFGAALRLEFRVSVGEL